MLLFQPSTLGHRDLFPRVVCDVHGPYVVCASYFSGSSARRPSVDARKATSTEFGQVTLAYRYHQQET